jgi:hypothetical protein
MSHQWRHNGITSYEHVPAPKDAILRRVFNWQVGLYCPEHPHIQHSKKDMEVGRCQQIIDSTRRCLHEFEDQPKWYDSITECAKEEGYAVYQFHDTHCWERDRESDADRYFAKPVDAQSVANDVVFMYTHGMPGTDRGFTPGIMVMSGDTPTADELASVHARQTRFFEYLFNEAQGMSTHPDKSINISDLHRTACEWLGRFDVPWMKRAVHVSTKQCPACDETIRMSAKYCKECHTALDVWYESRGLMPEKEDDPFVYDLMERKAKAAAGKRHIVVEEPAIDEEPFVIGSGKVKV